MFKSERVDFSIIIPTFNRSSFLKLAIGSVLRQKRISFEIIVGDNFSTDDTEKVVKAFKDKRIRYFKNKRNLGFAGNIRKCFKIARGKYVFTLGDDDLILDENTLLQIWKVMNKYKSGMGSIGTVYFSKSPKTPCKVFILSNKEVFVEPRKGEIIPVQALDFNVSFFTGLIFDRSLINVKKITDSFTYAYFPFCYDVISKKGIVYIPNYFTIGHISQRFVPHYFSIKKLGSFYMEDYLKMIKVFLSNKSYEKHRKKFLQESTILLPSIKLFTDNRNYLIVLWRMVMLDKTLLLYVNFFLLALIGLLPKFVLRTLRTLVIDQEVGKVREKVLEYDYFNKLKKLGI